MPNKYTRLEELEFRESDVLVDILRLEDEINRLKAEHAKLLDEIRQENLTKQLHGSEEERFVARRVKGACNMFSTSMEEAGMA